MSINSEVNIENKNKKPLLFSGITATGTLTLGHYIGVIQHLIRLQDEYQILLMIADLHALTTVSKKKTSYFDKTKEIASLVYACGLREENCRVFVQSKISEHLQLSYFLSSYCSTGRISNMIQYKEKSKESNNTNLSLLFYPILMAGDILLYDADLVIVGKDQKQHLELTDYIAKKFNDANDNCLKIPTFSIFEAGSKIMGLRNPYKKMSKSSNDHIGILDNDEEIEKKIMKAETDSEGIIYYDEKKKPGITNLLVIYSQLSNLSIKDLEEKFLNSSYNQFKIALVDLLKKFLKKIRKNFVIHNKKIDQILTKNNQEVKKIATEKLKTIKNKLLLWS